MRWSGVHEIVVRPARGGRDARLVRYMVCEENARRDYAELVDESSSDPATLGVRDLVDWSVALLAMSKWAIASDGRAAIAQARARMRKETRELRRGRVA